MLQRPDFDPAKPQTVAPGLFRFEAAAGPSQGALLGARSQARSREVVWWDPHVLHLRAETSFGLRRDDLIVKDGDMFAVEDRLMEYERWRDARTQVVANGARPSMRIQTATAWAADAANKAGAPVKAVPWVAANVFEAVSGKRPEWIRPRCSL